MNEMRITKSAEMKSKTKGTPTAEELELINRYTVKDMSFEDVYTFDVTLCDTEIDRDFEYFTAEAIYKLADLFLGKAGILDHMPSAKNQTARIYATEVKSGCGKTGDGRELIQLNAKAYIPRIEETKGIIAKIESGILKEVSVGVLAPKKCSICGGRMNYWGECASGGHFKGRDYDGVKCFGIIGEPADAYEFSFVAVPAQRGAGVTKSAAECELTAAFEILKTAPIEIYAEWIGRVNKDYKTRCMDLAEAERRKNILEDNKKVMEELKK